MGPADRSDWCALVATPLDPGSVSSWVAAPHCGAVVTFTGVARDHAEGRAGVEALTYEAYEDAAVERLAEVAAELRRWPEVAKVALVHRTGELAVGDAAVVVAVSAPHRAAAFEAASFGIDAVKATVPIWKRERWTDGDAWGLGAQHLVRAGEVRPSVPGEDGERVSGAVYFLLAAVGLSVVGGAVVALRHRKPASFTTSIDDFSAKMSALAPEDERER